MDIIKSLESIDKSLLIFILTSLFAFISWLIKGIIEKPINEAKITFEKTYTTRIEILTEIKNRLSLIGNFLDDQAIARESLQSVLALSLPGVTIGGMSFDKENEVTVTVSADSQGALKEALAYYKQADGFFPQVVSTGVSRNKEGKYEMKLTLTLPLKDEKS